jgi:hypothetical protein
MYPPEFPAGPYVCELPIAANRRGELIHEVEELPARLRQLVGGMNDSQLDTRYTIGPYGRSSIIWPTAI